MVRNDKGGVLMDESVSEILDALISIDIKLKKLPAEIQHALVRAFSDVNVREDLEIFGFNCLVLDPKPLYQVKSEKGLEDVVILHALVNAVIRMLQVADERYQIAKARNTKEV